MKAYLSPDEQLMAGALLPVVALTAVLVDQNVLQASVLRDKLQDMLARLPDELPLESLTNRVQTGILTVLTILSEYEHGDPDHPRPPKSRPDWLQAIIEGGRGKPDT